MPVIQVCAVSGGPERDAARLAALCRATAGELGLPDSGVIAVLTPVTATASGESALPSWPLAVVHGSPRPAAAMDAALRQAGRVLAEEWDVPAGDVWVEWSAGRIGHQP
ncbi:hypothetical protein DSC45_17480 [Streptomyces sp. YIM 130001]|uniref:hypothetical protein n=1 Tax=Streptomyces sp. YIM 130001 TaxID=2259644 RepID=UPI000ED57A6A|nr:hypothetical protein [Streptomyces sp. YIM 130001]RII15623.1 hypothetical protein DSC45_17480 [Streptomyces sp. YIM 130001]